MACNLHCLAALQKPFCSAQVRRPRCGATGIMGKHGGQMLGAAACTLDGSSLMCTSRYITPNFCLSSWAVNAVNLSGAEVHH